MIVESPRPRPIRDHPWAGWLAVSAVCLGAFMGQLDASIVTLTFPALRSEFGAPLASVQWVSLGYLMAVVGLVVPAGRVADAAGRKVVYLQGLAVFTFASGLCALAPNLLWLIIFRIAQALGAAMLQANSVALVVTSVQPKRMRTGLGVQAGAQALGLALGPPLGGVLVAAVGWRWVFAINVPVGCVALVAGRYLLPRTRARAALTGFDWIGLALLFTCTGGALIAVTAISGLGVPGWVAATAAVVALGAGIGFRRWEPRSRTPLVDPALVATREVRYGLIGALAAYLVLFGPLALFPQIGTVGAAGTGLLLTTLPVGFAVAAVAGARIRAVGRREPLGATAMVIATAALLVFPSAPWWVAVWLLALGLGLGLFIPANNAAIMAAVPRSRSGTAGGLVNMSRGLGTAAGVAMMTLALHVGEATHLRSAGDRTALAGLTMTAIATALTSVAGSRRRHEREARMDEPDAGGQPSEVALAEVIARLRRAMRRAARTAEPADTLSVAQLELLSCVGDHPGVRPGQVARLLHVAPNTVTTLVNALTGHGMLVRAAGSDRRAVTLELTDSGRRAVREWQATNTEILREALSNLHPGWRHLLTAATPALAELSYAVDTLAEPARDDNAAER
ncbi:MAG: MFS transporter [Nocardia sp.]|nr:MFS transporter [Nocardia sp.]